MSQLKINKRFRGYLPVVIDIETAGFNPKTDAMLEVAAVTLKMDEEGYFSPDKVYDYHIEPFKGANLDPSALEFTGINPGHPFRFAISELEALKDLSKHIKAAIKDAECQRGVMVGHNPAFDMSFWQAAITRNNIKRDPFHPFTTFDTATLGGLATGQTVLAKAAQKARIDFDSKEAHSAKYDAEKTAELFCYIVNQWQKMSLK